MTPVRCNAGSSPPKCPHSAALSSHSTAPDAARAGRSSRRPALGCAVSAPYARRTRTRPAPGRPRSRAALVPRHVAITMDGNGRWAKARGLPRTKGHEMGEAALFDVVEGAIEIGVKAISAYAFSTENWTPLARRGPLPDGLQPRRDPPSS